MEITLFNCALYYLIHKSFTGPGNSGDFDFLATGLWYDLVLTAQLPGLCVATND